MSLCVCRCKYKVIGKISNAELHTCINNFYVSDLGDHPTAN